MNTSPLYTRYDALIFDLDGTIYLGEHLLPGAAELLAALRASGRRVAFLSNNPTKTQVQYAARLNRLGIPASTTEIVTSAVVLVRRLRSQAPGARLHVIGEQPLIDELQAAGFQIVTQASEVDVVVASFDRTFAYPKLQLAFDAIRRGARFVATNADRYCPVPGGGEPDAAAVIAAVEACTGVRCEEVVGKPSPVMARAALEVVGVPPERCLMVGDRIETDIAMGISAGMDTALVLSGASTRADLAGHGLTPTYVLEGVWQLVT